MGRRLSFVIAGVILVGCVAIATILIISRPETARQDPPPRTPFVTTATVLRGEGPIPIYGAGTVRPHTEIHVTAEVPGRIVWVNPAFQSGGRVSPGEVLFRIDDADYLSRVDRARANVAAQEVELMRVTAESRIAKMQFEKWEQEGDPNPPTPLALWEPQIEATQAALNRDRAELAEAELRLSRTVIYSPLAAAVLSESVAVGQFITTGQNVGHLYGIDLVEVVVPLPDESVALIPELWKLKPGMNNKRIPARVITRYGGHLYSWPSTVDRAEVALEKQTRTIEVVIHVRNPFTSGLAMNMEVQSNSAPPLLIGKYVDVEIDGATPEQYFRVQRSALKLDNEVWVVDNGLVNRVSVQVLQRSRDEVFLTGSLKDGQEVVLSGIQTAIDGMVVQTES